MRVISNKQGGHADIPLGEQLKSSSKGEKQDTSTSHGKHERECTTPTESERKKEIRHFSRMQTLSERTFVIRLSEKKVNHDVQHTPSFKRADVLG